MLLGGKEGIAMACPSVGCTKASSLIATRASGEKKARFRGLAQACGLDESKLLTLLIDRVLARNGLAEEPSDSPRATAAGRITLRLRPGDPARLAERAATRGMKPSSYLTLLVHTHLRQDPPLPVAELAELKCAVGELSALGRSLSRLGNPMTPDKGAPADLTVVLPAVRASVEQLRVSVADLVRANLVSWESGDA
jgi:hypothetical protein